LKMLTFGLKTKLNNGFYLSKRPPLVVFFWLLG
jgi:hypothetical protein